jgi:hypothetical protein
MVDKFEKKGSAGSIQGRLKSKGLSNKLGDKRTPAAINKTHLGHRLCMSLCSLFDPTLLAEEACNLLCCKGLVTH